jgi:hypothetical protein
MRVTPGKGYRAVDGESVLFNALAGQRFATIPDKISGLNAAQSGTVGGLRHFNI